MIKLYFLVMSLLFASVSQASYEVEECYNAKIREVKELVKDQFTDFEIKNYNFGYYINYSDEFKRDEQTHLSLSFSFELRPPEWEEFTTMSGYLLAYLSDCRTIVAGGTTLDPEDANLKRKFEVLRLNIK